MNIKQALAIALADLTSKPSDELLAELKKYQNSDMTVNLKEMTTFCHSTEGLAILNKEK